MRIKKGVISRRTLRRSLGHFDKPAHFPESFTSTSERVRLCMCYCTTRTQLHAVWRGLTFPICATHSTAMRIWLSPLEGSLARPLFKYHTNSLSTAPRLSINTRFTRAHSSLRRNSKAITSNTTSRCYLDSRARPLCQMAPMARQRRYSSTGVARDGMPSFAFAFE